MSLEKMVSEVIIMKKAKYTVMHWHGTSPVCSNACCKESWGIPIGYANPCPASSCWPFQRCDCIRDFHCGAARDVLRAWNVPDDVILGVIFPFVSDQHWVEAFTGPTAAEGGVFCDICSK